MALCNTFILSCQGSGSDSDFSRYVVNPSGEKARILSGHITPNVSVSTHASNYMTWNVKKGSTTIATFTTNSSGGAALTAGTPVALTFTGTGKDMEIDSGSAVLVEGVNSGTGPAYDVEVTLVLQGIRQ